MDTAQCLDRWHEHFPTTLIAMRRDDSALQALSFWLSNTLHLSTMPLSANTNDFATSDGDDEVSVTNWRITKVASGGTRILAKLAVVGNHCHDLRVVWSTCG